MQLTIHFHATGPVAVPVHYGALLQGAHLSPDAKSCFAHIPARKWSPRLKLFRWDRPAGFAAMPGTIIFTGRQKPF